MSNYSITSRDNQNEKRADIEAALKAGGLVQIAGGTRNSYYGLPGQGVEGYCVRVGIRTFRLVRRIRLTEGGLTDVTVGKEHYHGKSTTEKVIAWAQRLVATEFGAIKPARSDVYSESVVVGEEEQK